MVSVARPLLLKLIFYLVSEPVTCTMPQACKLHSHIQVRRWQITTGTQLRLSLRLLMQDAVQGRTNIDRDFRLTTLQRKQRKQMLKVMFLKVECQELCLNSNLLQ